MADLFEEIAKNIAVIAKQSKLAGSGIQHYADTPPRVEESHPSRVEQRKPPRVPDRLVVACPQAVVDSNENYLIPPLPNYITKEQPEEPPFQQRSKRVVA